MAKSEYSILLNIINRWRKLAKTEKISEQEAKINYLDECIEYLIARGAVQKALEFRWELASILTAA